MGMFHEAAILADVAQKLSFPGPMNAFTPRFHCWLMASIPTNSLHFVSFQPFSKMKLNPSELLFIVSTATGKAEANGYSVMSCSQAVTGYSKTTSTSRLLRWLLSWMRLKWRRVKQNSVPCSCHVAMLLTHDSVAKYTPSTLLRFVFT